MAATKGELLKLIKEHEAVETPAQGRAEPESEERLERKAGIAKKAFWRGFEKSAAVFNIPHNSKHGIAATQDKLRHLLRKSKKAS